MEFLINKKFASQEIGKIFISDYKLKKDYVFVEDKNKLNTKEFKRGEKINIQITKSKHGNYVSFLKKENGILWQFSFERNSKEVQTFIEQIYNKQFSN